MIQHIESDSPYVFDINGDYKKELEVYAAEITESAPNTPINLRIAGISALLDAYMAQIFDRPPAQVLNDLANSLLYEDFSLPLPTKIQDTEHPFHSESQTRRRYARERRFYDGRMNNDTIIGFRITSFEASEGQEVLIRQPVFKRA